MKYRKLGKTDISVSEIGFGSWGIGGTIGGSIAYGNTEDTESLRALEMALEQGINFYDTAAFYGLGHSESLIGHVFQNVRSKIILATKVGYISSDGKQNFSLPYLKQSLEESLKRLRTDYVDLYQLHSPPIDLLLQEPQIFSTLQDLVKEGKARAIGISSRSPQEALVALQHFSFDAVQVNFNLVDQRVLDVGLLDLCKEENVAVIARTPLCFGFLTGQYNQHSTFEEGDHRKRWDAKQLETWSRAGGEFCQVFDTSVRQTPTQMALRFCLSFDGLTSVIPGMLQADQVVENAQASRLGTLSTKELDAISLLYKKYNFSGN